MAFNCIKIVLLGFFATALGDRCVDGKNNKFVVASSKGKIFQC